MKRILCLSFILISLAINASIVYDFGGIEEDQINVIEGVVSHYVKSNEDTIPSIDYTPGGDTMRVYIDTMENFEINYKLSTEKQNLLRFEQDYLVAEGKNIILKFSNLTIGDTISLLVSAKGGYDATFTAYNGVKGEDQIADKKDENTGTYAQKIVTFIATKEVAMIKEIIAGFRLYTATISPFVAGADNITTTTADIIWLPDTAVIEYTISIYTSDTLFAEYKVNAQGNVTDTILAPAAVIAKLPQNLNMTLDSEETFTISIDGLDPDTEYSFMISGTNAAQERIYQEEGTFRTKAENDEGIDTIVAAPKVRKILRNGQILILRREKVYTLQGQEVR